MFMPNQQKAGKNDIKLDNRSFEYTSKFKCLGTTIINQNCHIALRECLLSFGPEYFLFPFAIKEYKD
jgi:hypothetical protein